MDKVENNTLARLERRAKRIEITKNWFEIFAIFIGAIWALYIFSLKEAPNLYKSFKVNGVIKVDEIENNPGSIKLNNKCDLNFRIDLKNIGYKDLYIDSINTSVWIIPVASVSLDSSYLYFEKLLDNNEISYPFKAFTHYSNTSLCGYYPPDTESGADFDFIIPKAYDSTVMAAYIIFCHGKKNLFWTEDFKINGYSWKLQCIPDKKENNEHQKQNK
jgi:hypothetical protein